jgi:hypothetical protein
MSKKLGVDVRGWFLTREAWVRIPKMTKIKLRFFCQYNTIRMTSLREHQFYSIRLEFISDTVGVYTIERETEIEYTQLLRKTTRMLQRWAKIFDNTIDVNDLTDKELNAVIQNQIDFLNKNNKGQQDRKFELIIRSGNVILDMYD